MIFVVHAMFKIILSTSIFRCNTLMKRDSLFYFQQSKVKKKKKVANKNTKTNVCKIIYSILSNAYSMTCSMIFNVDRWQFYFNKERNIEHLCVRNYKTIKVDLNLTVFYVYKNKSICKISAFSLYNIYKRKGIYLNFFAFW